MESAAHVVIESLGAGGTTGVDLTPTAPELRTSPAGAR
jgi:hypothetical protein